MPLLLDLPNELLEAILDRVAPNDIENFTSSCKLIHSLATKILQEHKVLKRAFTRVESNRGPFSANQFSGLLYQVLIEPLKADYVQQVLIDGWHDYFLYSNLKMEAFKEAVKNTDSIPFEEKEQWVSQIEAGDENPVLALLLPRLHYLTSMKISLRSMVDEFMFQTVERVVKDPRSPSLSRLQQVEISGANLPMHSLGLLTVFAGLPSVISLKACGLDADGSSWDRDFSLIPQSSNLRDLTLEHCTFSCSAMFNLIKSAKSLRSFTYSLPEDRRNNTTSSFIQARAALLQDAWVSLEELSLRQPYFNPAPTNRTECSFKSWQKLRVLTINYAYLMSNKIRTTDDAASLLLPASLEVLNLFGCCIRSPEWFKDLVAWVARVKEREVPCLKELSFKEAMGLNMCRAGDMSELYAAAIAAGFELNVTEAVCPAGWSPAVYDDYDSLTPGSVPRAPARTWHNIFA